MKKSWKLSELRYAMGVAEVNALREENNTPVKFFQQKITPMNRGYI